jgi:hypothetical protein
MIIEDRLVTLSGLELAGCADDRECLGLLLNAASVRVERAFLDQIRSMAIHNAEGELVMRYETNAWTKVRLFTDCELSKFLFFVVFATASGEAAVVVVDVFV